MLVVRVPVEDVSGRIWLVFRPGRRGAGYYSASFIDQNGQPASQSMLAGNKKCVSGSIIAGHFFGAGRKVILGSPADLSGCFISYLVHVTDGGPEGEVWPMDVTITLENDDKVLENGRINLRVAGDPVAGYIVLDQSSVGGTAIEASISPAKDDTGRPDGRKSSAPRHDLRRRLLAGLEADVRAEERAGRLARALEAGDRRRAR